VYRPRLPPATAPAAPADWTRCDALRAEGRWREADAAFAEFAKTVPEEAIGALLAELAAHDAPGFGVPGGRGRLYPPGRHPLDRLWDRLFATPGGMAPTALAGVVRSGEPWVTPQARLRALAALEAPADPTTGPLGPELRVVAARRLLDAGWDREAADVLRRCLGQPGRPDLRHEAALGLLKLAGRASASAAEVQALWQDCEAVLADAPADARDAGVVHAASALASADDPAAALAMLQRHSSPSAWQTLAHVWSQEVKAKGAAGATQ
jgi:hypothetical protein